jgi:hypothetical protein
VKEVEPLLADTEGKGPFFGGSEKLTLAEVQAARILAKKEGRTLLKKASTKKERRAR